MGKGKTDTWKVVALVGGGALAIYFLTRPEAKEKVQEIIGGTLPSINLPGISNLLPGISWTPFTEFTLPEIAWPDFSAQLEDLIKANMPSIEDLLPSEWPDLLPDIFNPEPDTNAPPEHATWADVAYSLPSYAKGALTVVGAGLVGYGGYTLIRATSPVLRQIGTQAARAVGGAGSMIARLFSSAKAVTVSGQVVKNVPIAVGGQVARPGILGTIATGLSRISPRVTSFLGWAALVPAVAEGIWQFIRILEGQQNIGFTGAPVIDLYSIFTGKFSPGAPTLFGSLISGGKVAAAGPVPTEPGTFLGQGEYLWQMQPPVEPTAPQQPPTGYLGYKQSLMQPVIQKYSGTKEVYTASYIKQQKAINWAEVY